MVKYQILSEWHSVVVGCTYSQFLVNACMEVLSILSEWQYGSIYQFLVSEWQYGITINSQLVSGSMVLLSTLFSLHYLEKLDMNTNRFKI